MITFAMGPSFNTVFSADFLQHRLADSEFGSHRRHGEVEIVRKFVDGDLSSGLRHDDAAAGVLVEGGENDADCVLVPLLLCCT